MACLEKHWPFTVEEFIKTGGSPVATQRAFRIRFALGRREAVPDTKTIYRRVSNFRQTGQIWKLCRRRYDRKLLPLHLKWFSRSWTTTERLHQSTNIQGTHFSDDLFKTHWCKTAFYVLFRNRKIFAISSLVLNLFASQMGEFFLPHLYLKLQCNGQNTCPWAKIYL